MSIKTQSNIRVIAIVSDAYGGRGGIALYNQYFLGALCKMPEVKEVIVLPRSITYDYRNVPSKIQFRIESAGNKVRFFWYCLRHLIFGRRADLIVCSHIHLLPFAWLFKLRYQSSLLTIIYGVEAWTPTSHWLTNFLCRRLKEFISIRHLTARRFKSWAGLSGAKYHYLPNCIDPQKYGISEKRDDLLAQHDLIGKRVILTVGRLDSIDFDQRKGFDEVLEVLPLLRKKISNIVYVIIGDGDDRARLEKKSRDLGVADIVRFVGFVSDKEKPDYYRLADVFAMPGSNPIFDRYPYRFVFLEALACGVPVVGCRLEDFHEQSDLDAQNLIIQVDPSSSMDILRGLLLALEKPVKKINPSLSKFYVSTFESRLHLIVRLILESDRRC